MFRGHPSICAMRPRQGSPCPAPAVAVPVPLLLSAAAQRCQGRPRGRRVCASRAVCWESGRCLARHPGLGRSPFSLASCRSAVLCGSGESLGSLRPFTAVVRVRSPRTGTEDAPACTGLCQCPPLPGRLHAREGSGVVVARGASSTAFELATRPSVHRPWPLPQTALAGRRGGGFRRGERGSPASPHRWERSVLANSVTEKCQSKSLHVCVVF